MLGFTRRRLSNLPGCLCPSHCQPLQLRACMALHSGEAASNTRLSFFAINSSISSKLLGDDLLCRLVSRPVVYIGMIRVVLDWSRIYPKMLPSRGGCINIGCINIRAAVKPRRSCSRHVLPHFPKRFLGKIDVPSHGKVWIGVRNKCVWFYGLVRISYPFTEQNKASQALFIGDC